MRVIDDGIGRAAFLDDGRLVELSRGRVNWKFSQPSCAWSLLLERSGKLIRVIPHGGAASQSGAREAVFRFSSAGLEDGTELPLEATVRWSMREGLLGAGLELSRPGGEPVLHAVVLPDVFVPYGSGRTSLIVPRETGWEITDAVEAIFSGPQAPRAVEWSTEMQFYAWIEEGRGLYSDCRDERGFFKSWRFSAATEGSFRLEVRHLAVRDDASQRRFELPYRTHLGAFEGGWYEAAQLYRPWALAAPWAGRGASQRRGFISEIACWVWNRGSIAQTVEPTLELGRRLGLPVALDWYWWHKHAYDCAYPDYFPPREGPEAFAGAIDRLHRAGHYVQAYTNGVLCDVNAPGWSDVANAGGIFNRKGQLSTCVPNTFMGARLATMCRAYQPWHEVVAGLADQASRYRLDGLYLDMITTSAGLGPCYASSHDHAPGGGDYAHQSFRGLLADIRRRHPDLSLTSESVLENYLDLMDGHIVCGISLERFAALVSPALHPYTYPIPLLAAVYHGRCVCFGSYASFHNAQVYEDLWPVEMNPDPDGAIDWSLQAPEQFALELARTVVFGNQPMVANLRLEHLREPRYRDELRFLLRLCRFYHAHRDLLLWGRLLAPPRLECPVAPRSFLQRSIYTPAGQETYFRRALPSVLCSQWQSPEGRLAAVLVNYTRQSVPVTYFPPPGLAASPGLLKPVGDGWSGQIPPLQAVLIDLQAG